MEIKIIYQGLSETHVWLKILEFPWAEMIYNQILTPLIEEAYCEAKTKITKKRKKFTKHFQVQSSG